jgi:hypothetical protein
VGVRLGVTVVAALAVLAAVAALGAVAAPSPTYRVTFQGTGTEHQVDLKLQIEDTGDCEAAEHVDVTATLAWSVSWSGFHPGGQPGRASAAAVKGSQFTGTDVRDACEPDEEAPPGWDSEASCRTSLATSGAPQVAASVRGQRLVLTLAAPAFQVPVGTRCPLVVRNDQLAAHAVVQLSRLHALKRSGAITVRVGTASPGPGDLYAPVRDCSAPTKPYDGYRTEDHCQDRLTWSGAVEVTRTS